MTDKNESACIKYISVDCILTGLCLCSFLDCQIIFSAEWGQFLMAGHRAYPHSQMCAKELLRMQGPSEMFALFCLSNHYVFVCE